MEIHCQIVSNIWKVVFLEQNRHITETIKCFIEHFMALHVCGKAKYPWKIHCLTFQPHLKPRSPFKWGTQCLLRGSDKTNLKSSHADNVCCSIWPVIVLKGGVLLTAKAIRLDVDQTNWAYTVYTVRYSVACIRRGTILYMAGAWLLALWSVLFSLMWPHIIETFQRRRKWETDTSARGMFWRALSHLLFLAGTVTQWHLFFEPGTDRR